MYSTSQLSIKLEERGNESYNYPLLEEGTRVKDKIVIECLSCDSFFEQQIQSHLGGRGCPNCRGGITLPLSHYIQKCKKHRRNYTDFSLTKESISAKCLDCGTIIVKFNKTNIFKVGCKKCADLKIGFTLSTKAEDIITPKNTSLVKFVESSTKATFYCKKHKHTYKQYIVYLGKAEGCKYCNSKLKDKSYFESRVDLTMWDLSESVYKGSKNYIKVRCLKCNFTQKKEAGSLMQRTAGCSKCSLSFNISKEENELKDWLSQYTEVISNYRPEWMQGKELDIFLPKFNLAIEYNGVYWHSDHFKSKNYHKDKTDLCNAKDISLFHIWSDLWYSKKEIIKSMLLNKLNLTPFKIGARKCVIKRVDRDSSFFFLNHNHLQGGNQGSIISYGLYYKEELISVMTFRKRIEWELVKFATKTFTNIQGGFSKLLKSFLIEQSCIKLYSFIDCSWSIGDVYFKNGFTIDKYLKPDYVYISPNKVNRFHKSVLREAEKCKQLASYLRVYNSGLIKVKLEGRD